MTAPLLPYARPFWTDDEVNSVAEVIRSGFWTGGRLVAEFEQALAKEVGAAHVVCVSSGTAALHAMLHMVRGVEIRRSLVVTSALNFVADAAVAKQLGYDIAFTDIDPATLNMSADSLADVLERVSSNYEFIVVIPVHFAGVAANVDALVSVAARHGAMVFEDACHALPARYGVDGPSVGGRTDTLGAVFSFHPTKSVAAGEGGAVALPDGELAERIADYRNHNMRTGVGSAAAFESDGSRKSWYYEVGDAGANLRLSELHAALGLVQLRRLPESVAWRQRLARRYREQLPGDGFLRYLPGDDRGISGLHLFPVSLDLDRLRCTKQAVFEHYRRRGIALQVHYTPLYEQPAFVDAATPTGGFPRLASISHGLLSLPLFMGMTDADQDRVLETTWDLAEGRARR